MTRTVLGATLALTAATVFLVASSSIDAQAPPTPARTVQDGVFSDAQATRGQALYAQRCAGCHGAALAGGAQAPPLEGSAFRFKWRQEPLSALFIKTRFTMPPNADDKAKLTAEQGADLVAHILKSNQFPAGKTDFAAADAVTSTIGWPPAPGEEKPAAIASAYTATGTVNQLMRGVFFHNSNLIFSIQEVEASALPPQPPASRPDGLTTFDWGLMIYTGWPAVENAAASLADASVLLLQPGLRCENGRAAPITEPDWIRFTDRMVSIARRTYRLAQTKDKEAVAEFTADLSNACNACHLTYRDVGGRGRGANPLAGRCSHR